MREAGRDVHSDDMPPALEWENPVWKLFSLISTQWRTGFSGREGLDYNPAIALMQAGGWDLELGLTLLKCIETEILIKDG